MSLLLIPFAWVFLLLILIAFLLWISPGKKSVFNADFLDEDNNKRRLFNITEPFYFIISASFVLIFGLYTTKDGIVSYYERKGIAEKEYDWLKPTDLLVFPADQFELATIPNSGIRDLNIDANSSKIKHSSLIFSDLSLSGKDDAVEKSLKIFSSKIDVRLHKLQPCLLYNKKLTIKEKLPLLIFLDLSRNKTIDEETSQINLLGYWGTKSIKPLFINYWDINLKKKNVCSGEPLSCVIHTYNSYMSECSKPIAEEGPKGRTDFDYIISTILEQVSDERVTKGNPFVTVTIISDFAHEDIYPGYQDSPFELLELRLSQLAQKTYVKKIILLILPVNQKQQSSPTAAKRIQRTLQAFEDRAKHKLSAVYLNNANKLNHLPALYETLSETATCSEIDSCDLINFYYTDPTGVDNWSRLKINPISEDGDSLLFKFYTTQTGLPNITFEMKISQNDNPVLSLNDNTYSKIRRDKIIECKLRHINPDTDNLYLDVYSPETSQQKRMKIVLKPLLPYYISFCVIFLHVIFLTAACIWLTVITWFFMRKSTAVWRHLPFIFCMICNCAVLYLFAVAYWDLTNDPLLKFLFLSIMALVITGIIIGVKLCAKVNKWQIVHVPIIADEPPGQQ